MRHPCLLAPSELLRYRGWKGNPLQHCRMPSPSFRLEPLPGYAPTIGRLVGILLYARKTTLDPNDN